jgi:flavin-dependent dehydrogenase
MDEYGWDTIYMRFDRDYAPSGYTWSFPEGKTHTRWGNGVPLDVDANGSELLDEYLKERGKYPQAEDAREVTQALIPTARPLETCVNGNVGLIGDVGHHCDPLHGGGMMFGSRAGKSFAQAVVQDDLSIYDGLWKDAFLDTLQNRFVIRDLIYNMDNSEYDRFIASIKGFEIQGTSPDTEIPRMLWHCLKNDSGIFTKTAAQATRSAVRQRLGI